MKQKFYISRFYDDLKDYDVNNSKLIHIKETDLQDIIRANVDPEDLYFDSDIVLKLVFDGDYNVTLDDLLIGLNNLKDKGDDFFSAWLNEINISDSDTFPHLKNINFVKDDYLAYNDSTIIYYVLLYLDHYYNDYKKNKLIDKALALLSDLKEKKEYKDYDIATLELLVLKIGEDINNSIDLEPQIIDFFKNSINLLVSINSFEGLKELGFQYYSGSIIYNQDYELAEKYLLDAFNIKEDGYVANALGYIYYYGRNNNYIPLKEKAFEFFSLGYHLNKNVESTYKLSDCYLNGYGTRVSPTAAFELLGNVYKKEEDKFLSGNNSNKYADILLRIANFYYKGIYVDKDLKLAYYLLKEASIAIKKRIEFSEFLGDSNVAAKIFNKANEVKDELKINTKRECYKEGYVISFSDSVIYNHLISEIEEVFVNKDGVHVFINDDVCNYINSINYMTTKHVMHLLFTNKTIHKEIKTKDLANNLLLFIDKKKINFPERNNEIPYDKIIYFPDDMNNDPSKKYNLIKVEFFIGSKEYYYLCDDIVDVDEKVVIELNGAKKIAVVKEIYELYEDELPMPYFKYSMAYKMLRIKLTDLENLLDKYGAPIDQRKLFMDEIEAFLFNKENDIVCLKEADLANLLYQYKVSNKEFISFIVDLRKKNILEIYS